MITLREAAHIVGATFPVGVRQFAKDSGLEVPISVRELLKMFVDPEDVRQNIIAATLNLRANFGCNNGCTPMNRGENLNEAQVNNFFNGSFPWKIDCLGAARIIMARGLIQTLNGGEFDKLGYTTSNMHLEFRPVANANQMIIGEWCYFKNDPNYLLKHPGGGYQGENVIKVSSSEFYGFPIGKNTEAEWISELINEYNYGLPPDQWISSVPGFQGYANEFLNVTKISLDVWKLRKGP
jgi:hypothetical protein